MSKMPQQEEMMPLSKEGNLCMRLNMEFFSEKHTPKE